MIDAKYLLLGAFLLIYGTAMYFFVSGSPPSKSPQPAAPKPVEKQPAPTIPPLTPGPAVPPLTPGPAPPVPGQPAPPVPGQPAPPVPGQPAAPAPGTPAAPVVPPPTSKGPPPAGDTAPTAPQSRLWNECGTGQVETDTAILGFCGKNEFLNNYFPAKVTRNGNTFLNAEAAYHAAKFESQPDVVKQFTTLDGQKAYDLARTLTYDTVEFAKNSVSVMIEILKSKFSDPALMQKLKATAPKNLVEFNWWGNKFWGQSPDGLNYLGRALMLVRDGKWQVY